MISAVPHMNQPQAYTCPLPLKPLSYLPPNPIPLGCQASVLHFKFSYFKKLFDQHNHFCAL